MNIQLCPDYECHPIWISESSGLSNVDPGVLPIPAHLAERIRAWASKYESTYDRTDPASSGFQAEQEQKEFDIEGREIWRALREALGGDYDIVYFSVLSGWVKEE